MRALGFRFGTSRDAAGMVVALVGARAHHAVIDIVQLYGEQDAEATRVSGHGDQLRAAQPGGRRSGPAKSDERAQRGVG